MMVSETSERCPLTDLEIENLKDRNALGVKEALYVPGIRV